MTISHTTVTDNTAGGDGGGVFNTFYPSSDVMNVDHTIIAGNSAPILPDIAEGNTTVRTMYSLVGDGTGASILDLGGTSQIGTDVAPIDPLLGPLAYTGGLTRTHALWAGSPAVDAGDPNISTPPANDQRGAPFDRQFDGDGNGSSQIDIGAYERQPIPGISTLVVDEATDELDRDTGSGDLSLREATALANASHGTNTISFASSLHGQTLTALLGELSIAESLTVNGPGAGLLTISGADTSRIFHVRGPQSGVWAVDIVGLTLADGNAGSGSGGGVLSDQNLLLRSVYLRDNLARNGAGAALTGGTVTIDGATIAGNTTLQDTSSSVEHGGGIYARDTALDIESSTISGNLADDDGGGIWAGGSTIVNIAHSTLTANSAATIGTVGDGGGLSVAPTASVTTINSIIAGNVDVNGNIADVDGQITALSSLIGDDTGATFVNSDGSLIGTSGSPIDPQLHPLADNGGPTPTHALMETSPAVDSGDPSFTSPPLYDQRGAPYSRIFDGDRNGSSLTDMGAFELPQVPLAVDSVTDEYDFDFNAGDVSLREAILIANLIPGSDVIEFDPSLSGATLVQLQGEIPVTDSLTINGLGAD